MKKKSFTCIGIIKNKSGKIFMAGDRRVSMSDYTYFQNPVPKIRNINNTLIGASGTGSLCKACVDSFDPPEFKEKDYDVDLYMHHWYIPALEKHLKTIPGYVSKDGTLAIPEDRATSVLIVVHKRAFTIDIGTVRNPDKQLLTVMDLDDAPFPFFIGCGTSSAIPILIAEKKEKGYNTKEMLIKAMEIAADISAGCDNNIDIVSL